MRFLSTRFFYSRDHPLLVYFKDLLLNTKKVLSGRRHFMEQVNVLPSLLVMVEPEDLEPFTIPEMETLKHSLTMLPGDMAIGASESKVKVRIEEASRVFIICRNVEPTGNQKNLERPWRKKP